MLIGRQPLVQGGRVDLDLEALALAGRRWEYDERVSGATRAVVRIDRVDDEGVGASCGRRAAEHPAGSDGEPGRKRAAAQRERVRGGAARRGDGLRVGPVYAAVG